jgi:tol-pal system protein YbgF
MHPFGLEGDAPAGGDAAGEEAPSDDVDLARSPITEYKEAQDAYMAGDYEKAVELYSAYIRRYPNSDYASNALLWLGQSHYKIRQYEDAIEAYEQLRREHPESHRVPIAYFNEAAAHAELDNAGRAVELLEELVENYPASQPAREAKEKLRSVRR